MPMAEPSLRDEMFRSIATDLRDAMGLYLDMIDRGDPNDIRPAIANMRVKHAALTGFMEGEASGSHR